MTITDEEEYARSHKRNSEIHKALCYLFEAYHDPEQWQLTKTSNNQTDTLKKDLIKLTFDVSSQKDQLEELTKTEFAAQFSKLQAGFNKVISEIERLDSQGLLKDVDFENYKNKNTQSDFSYHYFDNSRASSLLLEKLRDYADLIEDIKYKKSKNRWLNQKVTKQSKIREREIALLILKVFEKNCISLPESRENSEVSNGRFRKTLKHIFKCSSYQENRKGLQMKLSIFQK